MIIPDIYAQITLIDSLLVGGSDKWWNSNTQLNPLRLPPPPSGSIVKYFDLNADGKPDVLRAQTDGGVPVQWVDDNANMTVGDLSGDLIDDCLMIDRNSDGQFAGPGDIVVDWVDTDGDGQADLQIVAEYKDADDTRYWKGHYMLMFDTDKDNVFNYIDWNTFKLRCWLHDGHADFYEDYHGNTTFLKVHSTPERLTDVRLNWENPFVFIDTDKDGLTEMTVRLTDVGGPKGNWNPSGIMNYAAISVDMDNDNTPENPLDLDMTVCLTSKVGTPYLKYSHIYKKIRGLPESDILFMDANWRQNTELIFPDDKECFDFIFKDASWDCAWFTYDEDGDCKRWERVEMYEPGDLYALGENNGGLDNHRQSDAIGDRGEWDQDNSGHGNLYISPMDGRLHLYGAEWGAWRIDQNSFSYQGMGGIYEPYGPGRTQDTFVGFAVVRYDDTDENGFFDAMSCDWNGDGTFDEVFTLSSYGLSDTAHVIDIASLKDSDYNKIYIRMADDMWSQAQSAMKVAGKLGLQTNWYALYQHPKSLRQKYDYGYWLQLYIYHDIIEYARSYNKPDLEKKVTKAYLSSSWNKIKW